MSAEPSIRTAGDLVQYQKTLDCVHCGLCLPACPTYELFGRESTSPRGRIYLMRALAEGEARPGSEAIRDLDLCLVCRACEPVCPSGVKFGEMMEFTRSAILEPARLPTLGDRIRRFALTRLLPWPRRLRRVASLLAFLDSLGLRALLRRYSVLDFVAPKLALRDRLMPTIPRATRRRRLPRRTLSGPGHRGRVAVLEGCVMPLLLGDVNRATVRVLAQQGFEVLVPEADVCCGALCAHFGALDSAAAAALRTIRAFETLGTLDAIVVNSAGCGAMMKEYGRIVAEAPGARPEDVHLAKAFARKVKDVSEFLVGQGIRPPTGRVELQVAYADACHLGHAQAVRSAPRELLRSIPGLELVELERSDRCCGAAGLYNALHPEESMRLLELRMDDLKRASPQVLATGNPGCLMQWQTGVRAHGLDIEVLHPVELFDRALKPPA